MRTSQAVEFVEYFESFVSSMSPTLHKYGERALDLVCDYILDESARHGKTSILLLVDELLKCSNSDRLLRSISYLLDKYRLRLFALVTTLDLSPVSKLCTHSGRVLDYIPMHLFSEDMSMKMVSDLPTADEIEANNLRLAVSDCGGHARTLEGLRKLWMSGPTIRRNYAELMSELVKTSYLPRLDDSVALPALRAQMIPLWKVISADRETFRSLIAGGSYLNVMSVESTTDVPRVSLAYLRRWAVHGSGHPSIKPLIELLKLDAAPQFNWQYFENFVANFIWLDRAVRVKAKYHGVISEHLRNFPDDLDSEDHQKVFFRRKSGVKRLKNHVVSELGKYDSAFVYTTGDGNPGFDCFTVDQQQGGMPPPPLNAHSSLVASK